MLNEIIEILNDICDDIDMGLNEDTSLISDLELSSLEFFAFIVAVEGHFGIRIKERELSQIDTLGELEKVIRKKI